MGVRVPPFAPKVKKNRHKPNKMSNYSDLQELSQWLEPDSCAQ